MFSLMALLTRLEMVPHGYPGGPSFEGKIPANPNTLFEEGFEIADKKIGYRAR